MFTRNYLHRLRRLTVVVHTRDGRSFRGVLTGVYLDSVALAHASVLEEDSSHALGGELVIPRENVAWLQAGIE